MSIFVANSKLTGINLSILKMLLQNELGGNDAAAFRIGGLSGLPASSNSGLTIGLAQLDVTTGGSTNSNAAMGQALMVQAIVASGYLGNQNDASKIQSITNEANSIVADIVSAGKNRSLSSILFSNITDSQGNPVTGNALNNALVSVPELIESLESDKGGA